MAKRKIIAIAFILLGFLIGTFSAITVIDAELYMNPMDYRDSLLSIITLFYQFFSLTSFLFVLIGYAFLNPKRTTLIIALTLGCIFCFIISFYFFEAIPNVILYCIYFFSIYRFNNNTIICKIILAIF
jgi:hypothetical protein